MKIKVCGMTIPGQVNQLNDWGVDYAGFIFYPKSPRFLGDKISAAALKNLPGTIKKVGVFVNAAYDDLMKKVEDYGLDMVQLHGDESPNFCGRVNDNVSVVKAFQVLNAVSLGEQLNTYHDECEMYLFDTAGKGYGGTGKKFNWDILDATTLSKPFFLSGGIEPGDVEAIKNFKRGRAAEKLWALDINSRFEISPGVKDMQKVKSFIDAFGVEKL